MKHMVFNGEAVYLLTDVTSRIHNPLHEDLVGRLCRPQDFRTGKFGWFLAEFEDGWHRICTSIVKESSIDEESGILTVRTANSLYTFAAVTEKASVKTAEEENAE